MGTKENKVKLEILKFLDKNGVYVFKHEPNTYNHTLGFHVTDKFKRKGVADILGFLNDGTFLAIETKDKTNQSADQILFQKRVELSGGVYILARAVEDVVYLVESTVPETSRSARGGVPCSEGD